MASDNAMPMMPMVRIFPNAPGLRPTACVAPNPVRPTPTAAPKPAKATAKLLVNANSANMCFSLLVVPFNELRITTSVFFLMLTHHGRKDRRQQHEHERLHKTHENFQCVEGQRKDIGHNPTHLLQQIFPCENVSIETQ